jgi:glucose-1-phosphate cytidylyltransferase
MKVVLFCGGAGLRLRGYADDVPKPMVTIGTRPLIWHLMKYYAHHGHKDFILCLGHKGNVIKDYFLHYDEAISNDFVLLDGGRKVSFLNRDIDDWTITFVQTGIDATIGERLKAVEPYLEGEKAFLANYGDGLCDLPLPQLIDFFERSQATGCLIMVQPTSSFDLVTVNPNGKVSGINGVSDSDVWINGGFFVFRQEIFEYIKPGDELVREPFQRLIAQGSLAGYKYTGFWRCMDTFKDKQYLEEMDARGVSPWKVWKTGVDAKVVRTVAGAVRARA